MNDDMKAGAVIALEGVREEINTILMELEQKGIDKPKGFIVLEGYVNDRIAEMLD